MNNEFKKTSGKGQTVYTLESATSGGTSSGSIASVSTPLGGMQRRNPPSDNILAQEADKNKVPATTPRNFVAKNAKTGGAGAHKDKKKAEKQGNVKHKKPYMEALQAQLDQLKSKVAEGKEDKIAQLKKDHETAVHWSQNERSPQKREAARRKAETIKAHLEKQYKQGVAEGFNGEYDDEAGMAHSNLLTSARAVQGLLDTIEDRDNLPEWAQEKIAKAEMMLVSVWDYLQSQKAMGNDPQVEGYGRYDRRDVYQRDYDHSVAGMDRGNNHRDDERHDLDDVELQRNRQEVTSYNITINGKPINPKPIFGRSATIAWGKEQAAAGVDLSNAMISPVRYTEDAYMESLTNMLERSVSQAQHNLMVGVAHNPQFAQKVKVKQQVGQEFAKADVGRDISKLPVRVPKKK